MLLGVKREATGKSQLGCPCPDLLLKVVDLWVKWKLPLNLKHLKPSWNRMAGNSQELVEVPPN